MINAAEKWEKDTKYMNNTYKKKNKKQIDVETATRTESLYHPERATNAKLINNAVSSANKLREMCLKLAYIVWIYALYSNIQTQS